MKPSRNGDRRDTADYLLLPHPSCQTVRVAVQSPGHSIPAVVSPGMGMKAQRPWLPPGGRLWAGVPDKGVGGAEI